MKKEKFEIWMIEFLSSELDEKGQQEFLNFIENNSEHQKEFNAVFNTWEGIDAFDIPEPSKKMDDSFFDMLHLKVENQESPKLDWFQKLSSVFNTIQKPQLAFGMLLLVIGLSVGYFLNSKPDPKVIEVANVSNTETEQVREQLVLTLLEQPSANKRLQGMNEAAKLNDATERVIEALFTTLNKDQNINVRLVAIESLAKYADTPVVRMGLVKSIALQESPLVQLALADLMVALQEKTSIESMKELLQQPDIDNTVKQKLQESINHII